MLPDLDKRSSPDLFHLLLVIRVSPRSRLLPIQASTDDPIFFVVRSKQAHLFWGRANTVADSSVQLGNATRRDSLGTV